MCTNQLHLPKNSRERLKLVLIKDGFEEIEHEFPFGTFRKEKQAYLFRRFVTPGNFPPKRPKKSCFIYFPTGFSRKVLKMVKTIKVTNYFVIAWTKTERVKSVV